MSNTDDYEARYAEILRRIEGRRQGVTNAPRQADLSAILDGLNALGSLEDIRKKRPRTISLYGPKALRGQMVDETGARAWVGALAWYKPRGYHHYRTVTLLGIWAIEAGEAAQIVVGTKTLEFDSPVFNPESYYRHIKRGFELYYRGDACPPPEREFYQVSYQAGERLALRDALQSALLLWAAELSTG